jgi:hypothetical protein
MASSECPEGFIAFNFQFGHILIFVHAGNDEADLKVNRLVATPDDP